MFAGACPLAVGMREGENPVSSVVLTVRNAFIESRSLANEKMKIFGSIYDPKKLTIFDLFFDDEKRCFLVNLHDDF